MFDWIWPTWNGLLWRLLSSLSEQPQVRPHSNHNYSDTVTICKVILVTSLKPNNLLTVSPVKTSKSLTIWVKRFIVVLEDQYSSQSRHYVYFSRLTAAIDRWCHRQIRKRKVSVMQRIQSVLLNAKFSEGTLWKTHWRTVAMLKAGWLAMKQFDKGESPLSFPNTGTGKHINKVSSQITQGRLCFCKTDQLCQTILYYIWIHIFSLLKWCLLVLFNTRINSKKE